MESERSSLGVVRSKSENFGELSPNIALAKRVQPGALVSPLRAASIRERYRKPRAAPGRESAEFLSRFDMNPCTATRSAKCRQLHGEKAVQPSAQPRKRGLRIFSPKLERIRLL